MRTISTVGFDVIPAIDVTNGGLGRLGASGPIAIQDFGGDPVSAAEAFMRAGARWLHVVDMDLAFTGAIVNVDTVMAVRRSALFQGVRVQASGGVATRDDLEHLLDVGVDRVVLGSGALDDAALIEAAIERHGERVAVGVEIDGARIRSRGAAPVDLPLDETLAWLGATAASRFVVTAVPRVGELSGPDLEAVARVLSMGRPVVAAGGIASIEQLASLRDAGAEGAIVGRAALEGGLDLVAAFGIGPD
jgi:phosphoribosylformimino-5-aminoimidazole carboxamide ribonucleotide (ProFAR) isomerase